MGSKKLQGISLVEVITSFAIIGVISIIVGSVYLAHFRLFSNQNTSMDMSTQARIAIDEITNQIQQAESIVATCSACGSDASGANILILRLWVIDSSGEPVDPGASTYDYMVFKRDSNANKILKITYPDPGSSRPGGSHVVAYGVSALSFTYDDPTPANAGEVSLAVSTTAQTINKTHTVSDVGKASLRNK